MEASAEYSRDDRLWPCDTAVFLTNPLSLAHGACGPMVYLGAVGRPLAPDLIDWVNSHAMTNDAYPPGVLTGLAGIALAFATVGLVERGESVLILLSRKAVPAAFCAWSDSAPVCSDEDSNLLGGSGGSSG